MAVAQGAVSGVRGALAGDDNDLRQAAAMLANELAGDDAVLALMQQVTWLAHGGGGRLGVS